MSLQNKQRKTEQLPNPNLKQLSEERDLLAEEMVEAAKKAFRERKMAKQAFQQLSKPGSSI